MTNQVDIMAAEELDAVPGVGGEQVEDRGFILVSPEVKKATLLQIAPTKLYKKKRPK